MGFALYRAQIGKRHPIAKTMKGFAGGGVVELVERHDGDAYRTVYTVKFAEEVYVLHAFQKRSKKGIATPKSDIDLIRRRLKAAEEDYRKRYGRDDKADDKAKGR
ncbi:MAG: type II toxin-antitoxin system RelE/ParE family toxin [Rhodospirillales bacterium]|nr:type II toxin-antitoxin system RelE/ParE family toxin [Rhodospirillales bacterium]MDH3921158.1 type II toxin-antitoxin system RelE/ParE family toxin [Rhodospirillales bacterium]